MFKEILLLILLIIGLAGTIIPLLPGIPFMFVTILIYGFIDNWQVINPWFVISIGIITAISMFIDYYSGVWGAKKYGASRAGTWGAILGGILGLFIMGPLGLFLGPLIGVLIGEVLSGKSLDKAIDAGIGTFVGVLGGTVIRVFISLIILFWTMFKIF